MGGTSVWMSVRIGCIGTAEAYRKLEQKAREEDTTVEELMEEAIHEFVK